MELKTFGIRTGGESCPSGSSASRLISDLQLSILEPSIVPISHYVPISFIGLVHCHYWGVIIINGYWLKFDHTRMGLHASDWNSSRLFFSAYMYKGSRTTYTLLWIEPCHLPAPNCSRCSDDRCVLGMNLCSNFRIAVEIHQIHQMARGPRANPGRGAL